MKKMMGLSRILTAGLALCGATAFANFGILENALPSDDSTTIVRLVDPLNPTATGVPLLLTNDTGYEIRCSSPNGLGAIFEGLGFNLNLVPFMETVTEDDPRVVTSNYQENPVLNCERGANHKLYVVQYPDNASEDIDYPDNKRYFISFGESSALNMIGCRGLIGALGFSLHEAEDMPYDIAQSIFVDVSDRHDIHCIEGDVVGPKPCGTREHGSTWLVPIDNGGQPYICEDGVAAQNGTPVCNTNYRAERGRCVYVPRSCGGRPHGAVWTGNIANGTQGYTCQDGQTVTVGSPSCNTGYAVSGNRCVYVPKRCGSHAHGATWNQAITGGTQKWKCNDGSSIFQSVSCNANYRKTGQVCQYVPKACGSNAHGSSWTVNITGGKQTWKCNDGNNQYVSVKCNTNYRANGRTCQYVPKNCGSRVHGSQWTNNITGGKQTWKCNDGSTQFVSVSCNTNYTRNGQTCQYVPKKCGSRAHGSTWNVNIANGKQTYKCNDGTTSLQSVNCNSHYKRSGNQCVYEYYSCGSRPHNSTWSRKTFGTGNWCEPPEYRDNYRCNDGTTVHLGRETIFRGIPRQPNRHCP